MSPARVAAVNRWADRILWALVTGVMLLNMWGLREVVWVRQDVGRLDVKVDAIGSELKRTLGLLDRHEHSPKHEGSMLREDVQRGLDRLERRVLMVEDRLSRSVGR
jgi:hypothetical protein